MAVSSVASVMVQGAESVAEATEPVKEACCGEEKEGDPPPPPSLSAAQPCIGFLPPSSSA
jgi:hypothetical protein